jgi:arsenate reductase
LKSTVQVSTGFDPKPIHPLTIKVMNEKGIDMSGHTSKDLKQFLGKMHFGIIITVCSNAEEKCPTFPGVSTRLHWPFDDPASVSGSQEEQLAKFREVRDQIEAKVKSWLKERGVAKLLFD